MQNPSNQKSGYSDKSLLRRVILGKSICILIVFLIFYSQVVSSQTYWKKEFPKYSGSSIMQSSDGNIFVVGSTTNSVPAEGLLLKTNNFGDTIWAKSFKVSDHTTLESIIQLNDGNICIVGIATLLENGVGSSIKSKLYIMKASLNGDTIWTKVVNDSKDTYIVPTSLIETKDGNIMIGGYSQSLNNYSHSFVYKMNADGDSIWFRSYERNKDLKFFAMRQSTNSDIYIAGQIGYLDRYDGLLLKIQANGDTAWTRLVGPDKLNAINLLNSITELPNGNLILQCCHSEYLGGGYTASLYQFNPSNNDTLLIRTYKNQSLFQFVNSVLLTRDKDLLVLGTTSVIGSTIAYSWLEKMTQNGESIWYDTYHNGDP